MSDLPQNALHGVTIVVTRPAEQAGGLKQLITQQGGKAIGFPALEIGEPDHRNEVATQLAQIAQFDMAIFISRNAVKWSVQYIGETLPTHLRLVAVGKSTGKALRGQWQHPVLSPAGNSNSETLLALPEMQNVTGLRVLIVRGQGGRELLAEQLTQRGASVTYAEVYKRICPKTDLATLPPQGPIDLISATSNETLQNLYDMANDDETRRWLLRTPLVVISPRTAELAQQLGFKHLALIADDASDQGLLNAMQQWRTQTAALNTTTH